MSAPTVANRIVFSGYTAAGKTTHARLVADELGWRYLGMAEVLTEVAGFAEPRWTPELDRARAEDPTIDQRADARMTALVGDSVEVVVDAWLQPWLVPRRGTLTVWVESSFRSRAMKCLVSAVRRGSPVDPPGANRLLEDLEDKDTFSRRRFRELYGVRFGYDPGTFSVRFDNSAHIAEPTVAASDRGIRLGHPALMDHIRRRL
ncbi:hypothetical protein ACFPM7_13615 [Actinokineospora guangxiensis]|uniref:Cytidylate kinase n=1 Tax=Actinokineospora guangxiensis TaxID=1490288 RepID=A0ABW0EKW2_9PSEU